MRLLNSPSGGRWLALLPLLFPVLIAGCSEEAELAGEAHFERLEFQPGDVAIEFPESRVIQRWESFQFKDGDQADWIVEGGKATPGTYQGQGVLKVKRSEDMVTIWIPVDCELDPSLEISILAVSRGKEAKLGVGLYSGKQKVSYAQKRITPGKDVAGHSYKLNEIKAKHGRVDRLQLRISEGSDSFAIRAITLSDAPIGVDLGADAYGGFSLIDIRGDARRATALPSGLQLHSTLDVRGPSDSLKFTFGQPDGVQVRQQNCELFVSLKGSGGTSFDESFKLAGKRGNNNEWQDANLSLAEFEGQQVQLSMELHSSKGAAVAAIGQARHASAGPNPPTVLLVTSDTHRSEYLGFLMEDGELRTEAIDRLAAEGLVFLDAVSSVNNTTPSHVSLMTGLSPRDTGLVANAKRLADEAPTLAEAFRDQGYATLASVSASPVNYKFCNLGQGFDRYAIPFGTSVHDSSITLERMHTWLEDYEGVPVFAWIHIYDAHGPYDPPDDYKRLYYDEGKDPFDTQAANAQTEMSPYWNRKIADPDYTEGLYKSEITYLDEGLGRLFGLPRMQKGIIALTSDHGEVLRYGPGDAFDHRGLSLNTLAVPLIFKAPGLAPGERRDDPVQQIDVGRTLLNLAGYASTPFPGRDLIGTSTDIGDPRFAIQANGISASVLTDKWMLDMTLRLTGKDAKLRSESLHSVRLYDIKGDRFCRYNVWEENAEKTASLRRLLIRWLGRAQNNQWQGEDVLGSKEIEQHLADLGYVTVEDSKESQWFDADCECDWCQKFSE